MCVLHVRDYRFAYDPAPVDIAVVCCSMGSRESEIRFCYARSTALVCRARRNSCFPLTLSAVASLESPRETTSRIYKGERASFPTYLPIYIYIYLPTHLPTYPPTHLPTYLPTYLPIYLFSFFPLEAIPTRPTSVQYLYLSISFACRSSDISSSNC